MANKIKNRNKYLLIIVTRFYTYRTYYIKALKTLDLKHKKIETLKIN